MIATSAPPAGLLAFRRRAISMAAAVLAVGMLLLAVVLEVTNPVIVAVDVVLLVSSAAVHAAAALTVGRRWDPGGWVCLAYLVVITLLVSVSHMHASTPQSDSFWFLLVPVGLSAVTMPAGRHAGVTAFGLASYVVMTSLGPGLDPPLTISRLVSMALFGLAMHAFAGRLEQALVAAEEARAALEENLAEQQRLNDRLVELDRAKDDFVASVSHELRTPLTVIMGLTGTLQKHWELMEEQQRRGLAARIGVNAAGLEGIVSTLLDLARIERGGLAPELARVDLHEAVDEALTRVGPLLADHQVVPAVPAGTVVHTDRRLLERVLDNLLTNAARHTPAGTTVRVTALDEGDLVRITVTDDGPGVAAGELARLGEQFFRAGTDRDEDGLGIGLTLVREVLAALDSSLEVISAPGGGMAFGFTLPRAQGDEETEEASGAGRRRTG